MISPILKIIFRISGLFLNQEDKLRRLSFALESREPIAVEVALLQGAKPQMRQIALLLDFEEVKVNSSNYFGSFASTQAKISPTEVINLCQLFQKYGVDLSQHVGFDDP